MSFIRRILHNDWLVDLFFFTILLSVFYLAWVGSYPVFLPDEARYTEVAREMLSQRDFVTPRVNGVVFLDKPILYYWLQALAIAMIGLKESAFRFFPAVFGIIGCLTTYIAGRLLFNKTVARLATLILATSPLYYVGAHYANLDLEVAVWISTSLLFFITAFDQPPNARKKLLLLAYAAAAGAVLTKGLIGFIFPVSIVGTWVLLTNRWRVLQHIYLPYGILILCLAILPWYVLVQIYNPEFFNYFFITQHFTRYLSQETFNNQSPVWFYLPIVLGGFFPWSLFLLRAGKRIKLFRRTREAEISLFLWLWVIIIFVFFSIPHSKIITYILPIAPALALLAANEMVSLRLHPNTIRRMLYICGGIVVTLMMVFLIQYPQLIPEKFKFAYKSILLLFAITTFALIYQHNKNFLTPIYLWTFNFFLCLTFTVANSSYLNINSNKILTDKIKQHLQSGDEVIHYLKYYYDVPLYLQKRITIVSSWQEEEIRQKDNWERELLPGRLKENPDWLITEDIFWQKWHGANRVFVFLPATLLPRFQNQNQYHFIAVQRNTALISNRPMD